MFQHYDQVFSGHWSKLLLCQVLEYLGIHFVWQTHDEQQIQRGYVCLFLVSQFVSNRLSYKFKQHLII